MFKISYVSTKSGLHGVKGRIIQNLVLLYQIMIQMTKVQNDGVQKTVANVPTEPGTNIGTN